MPRAHPPEFRERAVELARLGDKPVAQIATDLGISDSCLRGWIKQADIDQGRRKDGLTTPEREELTKLRRELRVAKLETGIDASIRIISRSVKGGGIRPPFSRP